MTLEVDIRHQFGAFGLEARFTTDSGLTALFGHSGAGKTSLVNIIAGLLSPDRGRIVIDGRVLVDTTKGVFVPKHRRRIGYVFQDPRLFPHLTVRQNLRYGRWFTPAAERRESFEQVIELLGLGALLDRGPALLSGGERQRVAIGRALLTSPQLLLMDEPLASLDDPRKSEILPYIERLRDANRVPIVYVSHSVPEITRLATAMVLLSDGRVAAAGTLPAIMGRLDLFPLTGRYEAGAVLEMQVASHDEAYELTTLRSAAGELRVPRLDAGIGARLRVHIRARDVLLALKPPEEISALNVLSGRIAEIGAPKGAMADVRVDLSGEILLARVTRLTLDRLNLSPGRPVFAI
ncbi:MAG TPA: molybdenum ABC transporter ATP-binding protein, partial [Candidatus Binataceae bacterium]|nr:molybdenum ABC transporter ATP-binding protein [Candidatus Binataceae bacterium]